MKTTKNNFEIKSEIFESTKMGLLHYIVQNQIFA